LFSVDARSGEFVFEIELLEFVLARENLVLRVQLGVSDPAARPFVGPVEQSTVEPVSKRSVAVFPIAFSPLPACQEGRREALARGDRRRDVVFRGNPADLATVLGCHGNDHATVASPKNTT